MLRMLVFVIALTMVSKQECFAQIGSTSGRSEAPRAAHASKASPDVVALIESLVGKEMWLRVDAVRIQYLIGGKDPTCIYPDGNVYYRAFTGGFRKSMSTSAEDFAEETRQKAPDATVRILAKGSRVKIDDVRAGKDEVHIELRDEGDARSGIEFRFNTKTYTVQDVQKCLEIAFATSKDGLGAKTVEISKGMSEAEIIAAKGKPVSRADLGEKVVLVYSDMKLSLKDGKLEDVE